VYEAVQQATTIKSHHKQKQYKTGKSFLCDDWQILNQAANSRRCFAA